MIKMVDKLTNTLKISLGGLAALVASVVAPTHTLGIPMRSDLGMMGDSSLIVGYMGKEAERVLAAPRAVALYGMVARDGLMSVQSDDSLLAPFMKADTLEEQAQLLGGVDPKKYDRTEMMGDKVYA